MAKKRAGNLDARLREVEAHLERDLAEGTESSDYFLMGTILSLVLSSILTFLTSQQGVLEKIPLLKWWVVDWTLFDGLVIFAVILLLYCVSLFGKGIRLLLVTDLLFAVMLFASFTVLAGLSFLLIVHSLFWFIIALAAIAVLAFPSLRLLNQRQKEKQSKRA